jgi:hypothetical protein
LKSIDFLLDFRSIRFFGEFGHRAVFVDPDPVELEPCWINPNLCPDFNGGIRIFSHKTDIINKFYRLGMF